MTAEEVRTILKLVGVDAAVTQVQSETEQPFDGLVIFGADLDHLAQAIGQLL